jgi:hypothetical protein
VNGEGWKPRTRPLYESTSGWQKKIRSSAFFSAKSRFSALR